MSMRLVLIEWVDSAHGSSGWAPLADCTPELLTVRSVGWLLHDTSECKVIVPHVCEPGAGSRIETQGRGDMTIPNACIVKLYDLIDPTLLIV